jgi:hypothetical protein
MCGSFTYLLMHHHLSFYKLKSLVGEPGISTLSTTRDKYKLQFATEAIAISTSFLSHV